MATESAHVFHPDATSPSPEIQTGIKGPAKEDNTYWHGLLEKTRQAAYQRVETYRVSPHVHTDEFDPLGN